MPSITDRPPADVVADLARLSDALDHSGIPVKRLDRNLLIATWNIRYFGGLTEEWRAGEDDSPKRDLFSLMCIGEIISRFDVIALQEVKRETTALRMMLEWLNRDGDYWDLLVTDVTRGDPGNDERLAFVFDKRRVRPTGLAGELVMPELAGLDSDEVAKQFARTPYAAGFAAGKEAFILTTLHVIWGNSPDARTDELRQIALWLKEWANDPHVWDTDIIALGDFNIDRRDDPRYQAFTASGLVVPPELHAVRRTLWGSDTRNHYDQIAWFTDDDNAPRLSMSYSGKAGNFDFEPHVWANLGKGDTSWRISDHYPLWAEFTTPR